MNWRRGLLRLWLVASLLWIAVVGWISWPGDALGQYGRYWYFRVAHSEVLGKQRANAENAARRRDAAIVEIRARYDRSRAMLPKVDAEQKNQGITTPHELTDKEVSDELRQIPSSSGGIRSKYGRDPSQISDQELDELEKVARTEFVEPESKSLQEFETLERQYDWNAMQSEWWGAYTFGLPILAFAVGAGLLWALRGFSSTRA